MCCRRRRDSPSVPMRARLARPRLSTIVSHQRMRYAALQFGATLAVAIASGAPPSHGDSPYIAISLVSTNVWITFTGQLQRASGVDGTWQTLTNVASPYVESVNTTKEAFFRNRP